MRAVKELDCEHCGKGTGYFVTQDQGVGCYVCKKEISIEEFDENDDLCNECFKKYTVVQEFNEEVSSK